MDLTAALLRGDGSRRESRSITPTQEVKYATRANRLLARVPRRSGGAGLFEVPRLEELVADPDKVGVLDAYAIWALRAQVIAALNLLNAQDLRLLRRHFEDAREIPGERLLRIKEASEKFAMSRDWLYRNYKKYGLAVRCGNALCFSERAMDDFVRKSAVEESIAVWLTRRRSKH